MTSTGPPASIMAHYGCRQLKPSPKEPASSKASFRASSQDNTVYELHESIILDSGSTCHVGNDRSRFTSFVPAEDDEVLFAGENVTPILG